MGWLPDSRDICSFSRLEAVQGSWVNKREEGGEASSLTSLEGSHGNLGAGRDRRPLRRWGLERWRQKDSLVHHPAPLKGLLGGCLQPLQGSSFCVKRAA